MPIYETYRRQVALLVRVLPFVAEEECFALKGGTAINLFIRDLPRLSVDIDLTFLPVQPRPQSLAAINAAMKRIDERIRKALPETVINATVREGIIQKLLVRMGGVQIKIEVTPVLRGCVFAPEIRDVFRQPAEREMQERPDGIAVVGRCLYTNAGSWYCRK